MSLLSLEPKVGPCVRDAVTGILGFLVSSLIAGVKDGFRATGPGGPDDPGRGSVLTRERFRLSDPGSGAASLLLEFDRLDLWGKLTTFSRKGFE